MRIYRLLIFHKVPAVWHQVETHMLLLSNLDRLEMIVIIISLANNHLLREAFHQMVWTVGNLLILKRELLILTVLRIHLTESLFQSINSLCMNFIALFDLVIRHLLAIKRVID